MVRLRPGSCTQSVVAVLEHPHQGPEAVVLTASLHVLPHLVPPSFGGYGSQPVPGFTDDLPEVGDGEAVQDLDDLGFCAKRRRRRGTDGGASDGVDVG